MYLVNKKAFTCIYSFSPISQSIIVLKAIKCYNNWSLKNVSGHLESPAKVMEFCGSD
jgi:hypothetical protein